MMDCHNVKRGVMLSAAIYSIPLRSEVSIKMLAGAPSSRDVIAFPKTAQAQCALTGAPAPVAGGQLRELHLAVVEEEGKENGGT
jgi:aspartyl-tRNA synthetase